MRRPSPIEPLSTAAADQTQTKPHSPSDARGLKCFAPRYGPAETCVATEHSSIQRSVGENTFFSQEAELNTEKWLFSVKQLAESDLGDSHRTSSCSWVVWLGNRTAWLRPLIYLAFLLFINDAFHALHITSKTKLIKYLRGNRDVLALLTCTCTINSLYITRTTAC